MSLCIFRRRPAGLASKATPRPPLLQVQNQLPSRQWNSTQSSKSRPIKEKVSASKAAGQGWTTLRVLGVMAVTAIAAGTFATKQARFLEVKGRDYSSPTKFHEPKYATIREMEAVSIIKEFLFESSKLNAN